MAYTARVSILFAALVAAPAQADNGSAAGIGHGSFWQGYTADMSEQDYRRSYRANKRLIGKTVSSYSENALLSLGVPQTGINLMGAAAGLAIRDDATLYLDRDHVLMLNLKDVSEDDRAVSFGLRFRW